MIKNTRNVRDLALAALDDATLDQTTGAGLGGINRFADRLPPEIDLTFAPPTLDAGCPACGYLSSDIPFELNLDRMPKFGL